MKRSIIDDNRKNEKNDNVCSFEIIQKKEERKGFLEKSFACFCLSRSN